MEKILGFSGQYRFLSNFAICKIEYNGLVFTSTEAAFQAAKALNPSERILFQNMTANESKVAGRKVNSFDPNWEKVKFDVMKDVLLIKFNQEPFKSQLLATGDAYLEETNTWGDKIWGVCDGIGENHLGKLLMIIREEIRDS